MPVMLFNSAVSIFTTVVVTVNVNCIPSPTFLGVFPGFKLTIRQLICVAFLSRCLGEKRRHVLATSEH